jgi:16S rRNA (uracil1498-N3)-methyltransferase
MRRRFFVDRFDPPRAVLSGDAAHHAARVLRASPGQLFELSDGHSVWLARVTSARRDSVEFALVEPIPVAGPKLHTALLLAIVRFDRFEWALEKATELGVTEITPLAAARSEKALVTAAAKRAARWQKILAESAQQSRRLRAPLLHPAARPADAFRAASHRAPTDSLAPASDSVLLFFSESPDAPSLRSVLHDRAPASRAVLAIGPEGGWTDDERSSALSLHFSEASLGPNILRTETAVAAALASVIFAFTQP